MLDEEVIDEESNEGDTDSTLNNDDMSYEIPKLKQKKLFWLISTGSNSSQLILINFFQYFAAEIVSQGILGYLTAIRNLFSALFQQTFGRLSDKMGRKIFLIIGFFLNFIATILLAFSYHSQAMLIIVATFHALSFSISLPVWNGALGDVSDVKGRTTFIGKLTAVGQGVGVGLMIILASTFFILERYYDIIFDWRIEYGIIFATSALLLLTSAIGAIFFQETKKVDEQFEYPKLIDAFNDKPFRKFIIVNSLFGIAMATLWPIYPVIHVHTLNMSINQLIIVSVVHACFYSLSNYFGGKLGDRFGRKPILFVSRAILLIVSLFYIPAIIYNSWYFALSANIVSGLCNGAFFVTINAYALDLSSEETRGSYSGLVQVSWGISTFIGALATGFIAELLTKSFSEFTMIIAMAIAIAILRAITSLGYLFIKESLPTESRINS